MDLDAVKEDMERLEEALDAEPTVFPEDSLATPVSSLALRNQFSLAPTASIADAIEKMAAEDVGCLGVVQENGCLVGIVTERDVLMRVAPDFHATQTRSIQEIMVAEPTTVHAEATLAQVLRAMHLGHYRHVPLVDETHGFKAIVSVRNILDYIVEHFPVEVLNLPPQPIRGPMNSREGA